MARVSRKTPVASQPKNETFRIWKTAIYVRLSVEDNGRDSDSIENQTELLTAYVEKHPSLERVACFTDNGYTGTDFHRPEFQRMMGAVQSGEVNCVVVKDLSRLGRNYIETSQFIERICPFLGLRFIAVNDHYDTATATSEGQLSVSLSNIINDYYAKDVSRKVITSLRAKMERGEFIANYAPHGYRKSPYNKNQLIVCADTAPVVQQIYLWRAEGVSYMGICKRLKAANIPSPGQYRLERGIETHNNKKNRRILWNKHVITEILQNPVYLGNLEQRKIGKCLYAGIPYHTTTAEERIVAYGTHEAIIDRPLFEKVQRINREAASAAKANVGKYDHLPKAQNIFGRKFVCGGCGAVMKLHRSFNKKGNKAYFTFKCPTYAEHGAKGCHDIKIRKSDLDQAVLSFLKSQMVLYLDLERVVSQLQKKQKSSCEKVERRQDIKVVRQKLSNKQKLLSELYVDLKDGTLSQEEYAEHREVILSDIQALQLRLSEMETEGAEGEEVIGELRWLKEVQRFRETEELTKEMVDSFVESMVLHEDSTLDIHLSVRDELAALTTASKRLNGEVA